MAGLRDTTAKIAKARRAPAPAAGRMREWPSFGGNPGALRMLSYIPQGLAPGAPLVVVLHGCTQHAEPFATAGGWLALADRCGFAVLAPEQRAANNPNLCFNWFLPGDTERGQGEAASIRAMVEAIVATHNLDPGRIFVTGLSAGGAMTAVMLAAYPEVFAGGAVIAGVPFGAAGSVQEALIAMSGRSSRDVAELAAILGVAAPRSHRPPRLSIWHGGADPVVSVTNANLLAGQWAAAHGLSQAPDESSLMLGAARAVWRDADGAAAMEMVLLPAMGHGAPLATLGADGLGRAAPFMLEVGLSSTLEIARFWGIAPDGPLPGLAAEAAADAAQAEPTGLHPLGDKVMASLKGHIPDSVQATIAKALKAAGLLG